MQPCALADWEFAMTNRARARFSVPNPRRPSGVPTGDRNRDTYPRIRRPKRAGSFWTSPLEFPYQCEAVISGQTFHLAPEIILRAAKAPKSPRFDDGQRHRTEVPCDLPRARGRACCASRATRRFVYYGIGAHPRRGPLRPKGTFRLPSAQPDGSARMGKARSQATVTTARLELTGGAVARACSG